MAISNALFDPDLISPEAKIAFPEGYVIRPLQRSDYGRGFFECLSALTYVGNVSEERFLERFDWMASQGKGIHYFLVIEHEGRIVGTGTLVVERKFIHDLGTVAHVEEVSIHKDYQSKGLGLKLINALSSVAKSVGCYKSKLGCSEANEGFYVKCGYEKGGRVMSEPYEGPKPAYERGHPLLRRAFQQNRTLHSSKPDHIPRDISSSGSLQHFKRSRKPAEAGTATNCMSCAIEPSCQFSAKRVYTSPQLKSENQDRWARIACPEMEECIAAGGPAAGQDALLAKLAEDYDPSQMSPAEVSSRNWFGRCVYEADNDVCDNQTVTLAWDDDAEGRGSKTATLHMVAFTKKICQRLTHIYGADGEITADSSSITVEDFKTGGRRVFYPYVPKGGGHGDADEGLARQFVLAVDEVKNHGWGVAQAQKEYMGCSLKDVIMSHSLVFAAEDARRRRTVVDFPEWWEKNVVRNL